MLAVRRASALVNKSPQSRARPVATAVTARAASDYGADPAIGLQKQDLNRLSKAACYHFNEMLLYIAGNSVVYVKTNRRSRLERILNMVLYMCITSDFMYSV